MTYKMILILGLGLIITSCNKDETVDPNVDYRSQYIGTYDCSKSNNSFDDPLATEIEVLVELDTLVDSLIVINGLNVPLNTDGTYGPGFYEGWNFTLEFDGEDLELETHQNVPGWTQYCYIKGVKR